MAAADLRWGLVGHLLEDAVDDAVGERMVAVAQQVLLTDEEIVVRVQLPELLMQSAHVISKCFRRAGSNNIHCDRFDSGTKSVL